MEEDTSSENKIPPAAVEKKNEPSPHSRHKWLANEAVRKTIDLFDGRIVDIRE